MPTSVGTSAKSCTQPSSIAVLPSMMSAPTIAGALIMKENFAALLRFRPESRPPASVEPLRETPGSSATPCIQPMMMACLKFGWSAYCLRCALSVSASRRKNPVSRKLAPRNQPVSQEVMKSSNTTLNSSVGREAMKSSSSVLDLKGFFRIAHQSFQNTMRTGISVPTCRRMSSIW